MSYRIGAETSERRSWHRLYLWNTDHTQVAAYEAWVSGYPDGPPRGAGVPLYEGPERRAQRVTEVLR